MAPIALGQPVMAEETLWHGTPSAMVLTAKFLVLALILIGVPLPAHWIGRSGDLERDANIVKGGWWVALLLAFAQLVSIALTYFRLRSTIYTITSQRVMVERGLLSKSLSEIDLRTIDDTQFFQTPFDRMLGIGNVVLISSDKAAPMFLLRGIRDPRGIRETIRSHAYQVSQRQIFTRAT
jgi:uncharacterized membrane protein YdbT with pleckstrin-like domain